MRAVLVVVALAGCSSSRGLQPDATGDATTDAPPYEFEHQATDVLVTATRVLWSQGDFICTSEACPANIQAPVVSYMQLAASTAYELDEAPVGSRQLAGDDQQTFYMVGTDLSSMFVKRYARGYWSALSIPRPWGFGPAVDADHVYWADTSDETTYTLRRASRTGDGTDATVVATNLDIGPRAAETLVQSNGDLWWIDSAGEVMHVATSGGTPTSIVDRAQLVAAGTDVAIVVRSLTANPLSLEIGTVGVDGVYRSAATQIPGLPVFATEAEGAVWWSNSGDPNIYSAPIGGGTVTTYAAQLTGARVFAVLPDRFLVDLTAHGLRSVPR